MNESTAPKPATRATNGGRGRIYGGMAFVAVALAAAFWLRPHDAPSPQRAGAVAGTPVSSDQPPVPSASISVPADSMSTDNSLPANGVKANLNSVADAGTGLTLMGVVQTDTRSLSPLQPGRIVGVLVHNGDRVRQGQLLIRLDGAADATQARTATAGVAAAQAQLGKARAGREAQRVKANADVQTAQAGLQQAQDKLHQALLARDAARDDQQAELTQARENVRKAQTGLDQARRTLDSLEELSKVGGVARNDLEGARTQVATAQSDLDQAQAQVARLQAGPSAGVSYRVALAQQDVAAAQTGMTQATEGVTTAKRARTETLAVAEQDIQAAAAAVEQARAGVAAARDAAQLTRLTSPQSGIVTSMAARVGETAQPGATLVTIVATTGYRIEALATARQLAALRMGQSARVLLDTRPGLVLQARITAIGRVAEADGRSFRVKLSLLQPPADLRPGQSAHILLSIHNK